MKPQLDASQLDTLFPGTDDLLTISDPGAFSLPYKEILRISKKVWQFTMY